MAIDWSAGIPAPISQGFGNIDYVAGQENPYTWHRDIFQRAQKWTTRLDWMHVP